MRKLFIVSFSLLFTASAYAVCPYFRTKYALISCEMLPDMAATEPVQPGVAVDSMTVDTDDLPGLEETPVRPSVSIACSCDYALKGSDPLCETNRTQEFTFTEPTDSAATACRPNKSLCATRCPKTLP